MTPSDLEPLLLRSPDEATARKYLAEAKAAGHRDAAVRFLSDVYRKSGHAGVWLAISGAFTGPELDGLQPPRPAGEALPGVRRPYLPLLPGALAAPFNSPGSIFMLAVSSPIMVGALFSVLLMGWLGFILFAPLYGYLCGFLFEVALRAAEDPRARPRVKGLLWSDESRLDFVGHFLRWLGAGFAAFLPFLFVYPWYHEAPSLVRGAVVAVAALLGAAWHPMALLQAAHGSGFSAFNYPQGLRIARKLGLDYAACVALFAATTGIVYGINALAAAWAGETEGRVMAARFIVGWGAYASYLMQMRAIGLLCWARADAR